MLNRNQKYWQEKALLMIADYTPQLKALPKEQQKQIADSIGTMAESYYRTVMEQNQSDPMSEMTAREFTEEMMQKALMQKAENLKQR